MNVFSAARARAEGLWRVLALCVGLCFASMAHTQEYTVFLHNDAAGTPVLATDEAGNVIWKQGYGPYGAKLDSSLASKGNGLWYTGKPYDENTGLSYMGARYYDPLLGRFTGMDPVGFDPTNLHSFNRYAYANNNPYKFVDPDGRQAAPALFPNFDPKQYLVDLAIESAKFIGLASAGASGAAIKGTEAAIAGAKIAEKGLTSLSADVGAQAASAGASNSINGLNLSKSLASQAQVGEAGVTVAGAGARAPFRDAARVAGDHGGKAADWSKKSSSSFTAKDGTTFETHWVENASTGQRVEFKTVFPEAR